MEIRSLIEKNGPPGGPKISVRRTNIFNGKMVLVLIFHGSTVPHRKKWSALAWPGPFFSLEIWFYIPEYVWNSY